MCSMFTPVWLPGCYQVAEAKLPDCCPCVTGEPAQGYNIKAGDAARRKPREQEPHASPTRSSSSAPA